MKPRLEPIEHSADDRRANRNEKFLGSLDLIEIGASGADHQKDCIHHASEEHRIIGGQVQPARDKLLFIERLGIVPGCDLGFDFGDVRSSEERFVAIGAKKLVGGVHAVDTIETRVENVPAAGDFCARRATTVPQSTA